MNSDWFFLLGDFAVGEAGLLESSDMAGRGNTGGDETRVYVT